MSHESVSLREYLELQVGHITEAVGHARRDLAGMRTDITKLQIDVQGLKAQQSLRGSDWAKLGSLSGAISVVVATVALVLA